MSTATSDRITTYRHDGLTFDVRDEGPLDGTRVVLLHGFPERSTSWRHVAPLLHEAGMRTFALDQRGYSPGARPGRRRDYRTSKLCGDVVALVEKVGAPVHLVGHDWGAIVGWLLVSKRPELFTSFTAVSVPHPASFFSGALTSGQLLKSWYIGFFQLPRLAELAAAVRGGPFDLMLRRAGMTPEEVDRFRTEIVEDGALPHALGWYRAAGLPELRGGSGSASAAAAKVRVPTTLVWSDGDVAVARRGVEGCERWVDAPYELVELEGVTHWIPTQAPEECARAILRRIGASE